MADNRRFGFKNMGHMSASGFRRQSGEGQMSAYDQGVQTAVQIHQSQGINALLDYLASLA